MDVEELVFTADSEIKGHGNYQTSSVEIDPKESFSDTNTQALSKMLSFFSFHLDNFVKEARQESVLRRNPEPRVVWLFSAVFTHYNTLCEAFVALLATEGFLP